MYREINNAYLNRVHKNYISFVFLQFRLMFIADQTDFIERNLYVFRLWKEWAEVGRIDMCCFKHSIFFCLHITRVYSGSCITQHSVGRKTVSDYRGYRIM